MAAITCSVSVASNNTRATTSGCRISGPCRSMMPMPCSTVSKGLLFRSGSVVRASKNVTACEAITVSASDVMSQGLRDRKEARAITPTVAVKTDHRRIHAPNMLRSYKFVGRLGLIPKANEMPPRFLVDEPEAVRQWQATTRPDKEWDGSYAATFIVDLEGRLWIADRRSEHVACARTAPVLAAGEMYFEFDKTDVRAARVTNQSTGYCPEPSSWEAVAVALDKAGISHLSFYDEPFEFRYCLACQNICIIKGADFCCPLCSQNLPEEWNLDEVTPH